MSTQAPTLTLNGQGYPLRWDYAAIFRLIEAGRETALEELQTKKGFKAAIELLWAMLDCEDAARALPSDSPQALARALGTEGLSPEHLIALLSAALAEGEAALDAKKNAATNTSLSPGSSSGSCSPSKSFWP